MAINFVRSPFAASLLFLFALSFMSQASANVTQNLVTECHRNIAKKICYVDDQTHRKCLDKPNELAHINVALEIERIFEKVPILIKQAVCRLDQIKIARKTYEHGAAGFVNPNEKHRIIYLNLNSFVDEHASFWGNERALFQYQFKSHGANRDRAISDMNFVSHRIYFEQGRAQKFSYGLAELLIHEIAHIIDIDAGLNPLSPLRVFRCFKTNSIKQNAAIQKSSKLIKGYDSIFTAQLDQQYDSDLLLELSKSEFISFSALINEVEDFAETLTSYIMLEHLGVNEKMTGKSGLLYERKARLKHQKIQPKLNIIKKYIGYHELNDAEKEKLKQDQLHCLGDFAPAQSMLKSN